MDYSKAFNERAKQAHLELSLKGAASDAGLQELNNAPAKDTEYPKDKKKKDSYFELLQLVVQTQLRLQEFIDRMNVELYLAEQELQRFREMIDERKALEHCRELLDRGEILERNPDGTLKDRHLHYAIENYAKNNKLSTDFSDDAYVLAIANETIEQYPSAIQLEKLAQVQSEIVNVLQTGIDEAESIQQDLDNTDNLSKSEVQQKCFDADVLIKSGDETINHLTKLKTTILSNNLTDETNSTRQLAISTLSF